MKLFDIIQKSGMKLQIQQKEYLYLHLFLVAETRKEQSSDSIANAIIVDLEKLI